MNVISRVRTTVGGGPKLVFRILDGTYLLGHAARDRREDYPWLQLVMSVPVPGNEPRYIIQEFTPALHVSAMFHEVLPEIRLFGIMGLLPEAWTYYTKQELGPLPKWSETNTVYFDDRPGQYFLWIKTDYVDPQTQEKSLRWYWQACLQPDTSGRPM